MGKENIVPNVLWKREKDLDGIGLEENKLLASY